MCSVLTISYLIQIKYYTKTLTGMVNCLNKNPVTVLIICEWNFK